MLDGYLGQTSLHPVALLPRPLSRLFTPDYCALDINAAWCGAVALIEVIETCLSRKQNPMRLGSSDMLVRSTSWVVVTPVSMGPCRATSQPDSNQAVGVIG